MKTRIRTLDEVFGQIKELNEEPDEPHETSQKQAVEDGIQVCTTCINPLKEADRKILNKRILGIMGIFSKLADPSVQLQALDPKTLVHHIVS